MAERIAINALNSKAFREEFMEVKNSYPKASIFELSDKMPQGMLSVASSNMFALQEIRTVYQHEEINSIGKNILSGEFERGFDIQKEKASVPNGDKKMVTSFVIDLNKLKETFEKCKNEPQIQNEAERKEIKGQELVQNVLH